jgi:hypothetical protein
MSSSFERYLRRLRDPRWIPHISSYCDSRCEQCAFTERCWSFAVRQGLESDDPEGAAVQADDEFESKVPPAPSWTERSGIDLNTITVSPSEEREYEERARRIDCDPLVTQSRAYLDDACDVLRPVADVEEKSSDVRDLYGWALTIGVKTHRAVSSSECDKDEELEDDPIQNDANGSVKRVRLCIQESLAAWNRVSGTEIDSGLVGHLTAAVRLLDTELERRFPLAMAFVRPGFDEEVPGLVRPWALDGEDDEEER